jgi:hypothetical protein
MRDFGFDPIYDLLVERHIVVRKIDIGLQPASRDKEKKRMNVLSAISADYQATIRSVEAKASVFGNAEPAP